MAPNSLSKNSPATAASADPSHVSARLLQAQSLIGIVADEIDGETVKNGIHIRDGLQLAVDMIQQTLLELKPFSEHQQVVRLVEDVLAEAHSE